MILRLSGGCWYIDVRPADTSDQLSFDLVHHLPRRIAAGRCVIVADDTRVFSSVIRKRWARLLRDVEHQRSSTLDRFKKEGLQDEIDRMRTCRFTTKPPTLLPGVQVYCLAPHQLPAESPRYMTLYLTLPLALPDLELALGGLKPGGLIVVYGPWQPHYTTMLRAGVPAGSNRARHP